MVSLEWEENIFIGLKTLYEKIFISPAKQEILQKQVVLEEQKLSLLIFAKLLSGQDVTIFETDDPILYFCNRICLPTTMHLAINQEQNRECYLLRTAVAATAIRLKLNSQNTDVASLIQLCSLELAHFEPRLAALIQDSGSSITLSQLIPRLPTIEELAVHQDTKKSSYEAIEHDDSTIITEIQGKGRVNITEIQEDNTGQQDTPFHTFEKVETLDEYNGLSRQNDADDELAEHQEALNELKMDSVIRSQDRSNSLYKADIVLDGLGFELESVPTKGIPYPEWDYKKRSYKENWCYVQELSNVNKDSLWAQNTKAKYATLITTLKKRFSSTLTEWKKAKRQVIGDDFDIEAITELLIRLKTKETPNENLYLGRKSDFPKIATLFLIDTSYSTDSWILNRRVMDVIKETVLCISELLEENIQPFGIYGFSSNTRQNCRMIPIKRFNESWKSSSESLGGLQAAGYTRIGTALRHSYEQIMPKEYENKLVLLLTDGKPCDYDRYEGQYGIRDVRKAILEGKSKGITTHAFAIDKQAREYFPSMFSSQNYNIVDRPENLVTTLFQVYLKLLVKS